MAKPFLTDQSRKALADAVHAVEARSSAELIVAVRPRSASYLHAALMAGMVAGSGTLAFLLFSPWEFGLEWFLVDPVAVGALAVLAGLRIPALTRLLTRRTARRERVEAAARSTFLEKRMHRTAGRTGILLYVSLLEREAAVVVDLGVESLAETEVWRKAVAGIGEAVRHGGDGNEVAERIRGLGEVLASALERDAADVDELPNEVCAP
jgi:putative membrane protein